MERLIITFLFLLVKLNIVKMEKFRLDINPITPIYWVDSQNILVNEKDNVYLFDIENRNITEKHNKKENEVWGYENGKFIICEYKNRDIKSKEEYSTHLTIHLIDGENILDVELRPTVEVVECRKTPILKTVFPIEEKFFSFNKKLYEVSSYEVDLLSPNFLSIIQISIGNKYWITKFSI